MTTVNSKFVIVWLGVLLSTIVTLSFAKHSMQTAKECLAITNECLETVALTATAKQRREFESWKDSIQGGSFLHPDQRQWFKGTFHTNDSSHQARFRIKGDLYTHFRGHQNSLRISKVDAATDVKKTFDYIVPWDKDYGIEPLAQNIAKELGMIAIVGKFKLLSVFGDKPKLYYVVEHPTEVWLEQNGLYAAPIFTFLNSWTVFDDKQRLQFQNYTTSTDEPYLKNSFLQTTVRQTYPESYKDSVLAQTTILKEIFVLAKKKDWSNKDISFLVRYLDTESFERFFALQCFFGSYHGLYFNNNIRLYFNPKTTKFELIPWDIALMRFSKTPQCQLSNEAQNNIFFRLMSHQVISRSNFLNTLSFLFSRRSEYRSYLTATNDEIFKIAPNIPHIEKKIAALVHAFDQNMIELELFLKENEAQNL